MVRQFVSCSIWSAKRPITRGLSKVTTTIKLGDQEVVWTVRGAPRRYWDYERRRRSAARGLRRTASAAERRQGDQRVQKERLPKIETAFSQFPDADDLLTAVVLEAKSKRVIITRGEGETTPGGEAIRFVRNALAENARPASACAAAPVLRMTRGREGRPAPDPTPGRSGGGADPNDGAVRSLVGGFDFGKNQFNHVTRRAGNPVRRSSRSSILAALEKGINLDHRHQRRAFSSSRRRRPAARTGSQNYDGKFEGPMRVRTALLAKIEEHGLHPRAALDRAELYARRTTSPSSALIRSSTAYLTLALGAGSDQSNADGRRVLGVRQRRLPRQTYFIKKASPIRRAPSSSRPNRRWSRARTPSRRSTHQRVHHDHHAARRVARWHRRQGDGARPWRPGWKTGTTNDSVDAWFAGSISRWWASPGLASTSRSRLANARPVAALRRRSGSTT